MTIRDNVEAGPLGPPTRQLTPVEAADRLDTEYAMLVEARSICRTHAEDEAHIRVERAPAPETVQAAYRSGRVAEAWERAERAIFEALSTAAHMGDDEQATLALRASER